MNEAFPTPAAFDRALKKAARNSEGDPGEAYRQALRDRFLCRIFHSGNERFVLKGGSGMLARIPDARATRDLDFATQSHISAEAALAEMEHAAAVDLGDWCSFRLTKNEESMDDNGYSRLLRLRFATYIGAAEKDPILIDLSLDCTTTLPPERITPANRLEIDGVPSCDYLVYPLPDQLADKFCAIMGLTPGGYSSSRMKDLIDVVSYATNKDFDLGQLRRAIEGECSKRKMDIPQHFTAPVAWKNRFDAFARKSNLPKGRASFKAASELASWFFDPALSGNQESTNATWDSTSLKWVAR